MTLGRIIGGLLMGYAGLYLAQYIGSSLYDTPQQVWDVLNYVTAAAVLVALAVNRAHLRSGTGFATALFVANAVLAIWFFAVWLDLLTLNEGERVSEHHNVIWEFVAVMVPVVLAATGRRLWQST